MSTASIVCFPCRKRRNLKRFDLNNPPPYSCPDCHGNMIHVGTKLQVPQRSDEKGWRDFYDVITAPGFWFKAIDVASFDPGRAVENKHWMECKAKGTTAGCERCREVDRRHPKMDWNQFGKKAA